MLWIIGAFILGGIFGVFAMCLVSGNKLTMFINCNYRK